MANVSGYAQKAMLDWVLGGATPTRPATWFMGLSLGAPSATSGSEVGTASGYSRVSASMAPTIGAGTVVNASVSALNAFTFGPFSTAQSVSGWQIWDTSANTTPNYGNMLWFGTLATARTVGVGDSITIPIASLLISLT